MKRILKFMMLPLALMVSLVGCGDKPTAEPTDQPTEPSSVQPVEKHTVQFYVEDTLYKTLKVENDTVIGAANVANPIKEGFSFTSWVDEANNSIDLDTYKVTEALKLYATFEEVITDDTLVVNGVKEEGVDYYLVVGWWETTSLNEDGTPKITSSLTTETVRLFYSNLLLYLEAYGATDEQIKGVQFRDYSTEVVAEMGEKINADGDVDLVIGVGNNINSSAGVSLFEGNDGKTTANMGSEGKSRYVALPSHEEMNSLAISIFDWIKTDVGQTAFTKVLEEKDITVVPARTNNIDLTTTIHGLSGDPVVTTLTTKEDVIQVPEITVEDGYKFLGYALTSDATEADIAIGAGQTLTYKQVEELLNGATTLTLYPVIIQEIVDENYDLVVYIHATSSSNISVSEVELYKARFEATLTEKKNINYVVVTEGAADDFAAVVSADIAAGKAVDVVIGGNKSFANLVALDETHAITNCDPSHFNSSNRKVIVSNSCASTHEELAKQLYAFSTTEAPEYAVSVAYWANLGKSTPWVSEAEIDAINAGIQAHINALFEVVVEEGKEDAFAIYNLSYSYYVCESSAVADLSAETKALNDGNGVGLIVGTGGNATNEANMGAAIIEQKDCPTTIVANNRKVAICNDSYIYAELYQTYFAVEEEAETLAA